MAFVAAFVCCGSICLIAQLIYDRTRLTAGHITSIFVVAGAALDTFGFYDWLLANFHAGAALPITSFGHSLIHGALEAAKTKGAAWHPARDLRSDGGRDHRRHPLCFLAAVFFRPKS
ncbi:MAG: SpoVA/SpoVAEb family sporulation membrane protein [Merdibacter sp.]